MNKKIILLGALLFPCMTFAQNIQQEQRDSIIEEDLSLVGVMDASVFDNDGEEGDNSTSQDINTTVLTSHDVYLNKIGYQLSNMRFRTRGYENIYSQTYINGVPFNAQLRGVFNVSSIGAINDFTRNGDAITIPSQDSLPSAPLAAAKTSACVPATTATAEKPR